MDVGPLETMEQTPRYNFPVSFDPCGGVGRAEADTEPFGDKASDRLPADYDTTAPVVCTVSRPISSASSGATLPEVT